MHKLTGSLSAMQSELDHRAPESPRPHNQTLVYIKCPWFIREGSAAEFPAHLDVMVLIKEVPIHALLGPVWRVDFQGLGKSLLPPYPCRAAEKHSTPFSLNLHWRISVRQRLSWRPPSAALHLMRLHAQPTRRQART